MSINDDVLHTMGQVRNGLSSIQLVGYDLNDNDIRPLLEMLLHDGGCPTVRVIYLGSNLLGPASANLLGLYLCSPKCAVERLQLRHNPNLGDAGMKALLPGLAPPTCPLRYLGMSRCELTGNALLLLGRTLRENRCSRLIHLDLMHNDRLFSPRAGIYALAAYLRWPDCPLRYLDLGDCYIDKRGASCLLRSIRWCRSMECIEFDSDGYWLPLKSILWNLGSIEPLLNSG